MDLGTFDLERAWQARHKGDEPEPIDGEGPARSDLPDAVSFVQSLLAPTRKRWPESGAAAEADTHGY